jgi:hypothetical protein
LKKARRFERSLLKPPSNRPRRYARVSDREAFPKGFHASAAGGAALPEMLRPAFALDYPARRVRWIVGFPPGGPNDITARIMAGYE